MSFRESFKKRYPLIFATVVSFLSVCTAGVSTFAWFTAQANVNIKTAETSITNITVTKPEAKYSFCAYKGNRNNAEALGNTHLFENDFTVVTDENNATLTTLSNMYPGERMVFALKLNSLTVTDSPDTTDSIVLQLDQLLSMTNDDYLDDSGNHIRNHRHVFDGNTAIPVNIGWAMNIYVDCIPSASYHLDNGDDTYTDYDVTAITGTNKLGFSPNTPTSTFFANASQNATSLVWTFGEGHEIELYNEKATASSMILFFVIEFSTADDALYKEVDYSTGLDYLANPPVIADSQDSNYRSDDHHYDNRRFVKYTSSDSSNKSHYNSNCFADLGFEIKNLILS